MGSTDPAANLVLDAQPSSIRTLPPVLLYPYGDHNFDNWPGKIAGAQEVRVGPNIFNVSEPSYQAFLPDPKRNTRSAVIIAPGGGFRQVSIESEGNDVAKWLAARGIAAFTLKYRLVQQAGPTYSMMARMQDFDMDVAGAPGVADGIETIKQIRSRAEEYGIDPNRIIFIGFSAGAHIAAFQALNPEVSARPNFVAPIYGAPFASLPEIPATGGPMALPPIFMAGSQDDRLAGEATARFYEALLRAGYRPEAHFFVNGFHGYGLNETRNSSRHFIEEFYWWLETLGLTRKPGDPDMKATIRGQGPPAAAPAPAPAP